jgi:uncharacterized protein
VPNVVLDANTLVSAFVARRPDAAPRRALALARMRFTLCLSRAVEDELRGVLLRSKFERYGATPETVARYIEFLTAGALYLEPAVTVQDCRDPDDNRYLELALAAGAEAIVTGDDDLLVLRAWRGIAVLTPTEFVGCFGVPDPPT